MSLFQQSWKTTSWTFPDSLSVAYNALVDALPTLPQSPPQRLHRYALLAEQALAQAVANGDAIVFAGLMLCFRFLQMPVQRRRRKQQSNATTRNASKDVSFWHGPVPLYLSICFWNPVTQRALWPAVDQLLVQQFQYRDLPVAAMLASLDVAYFVGSAVWHRFLGGAKNTIRNITHGRPSSSSSCGNHKPRQRGLVPRNDVEDDYRSQQVVCPIDAALDAQKQNRNYKDASLYAFIDKCQAAKQQLNHVHDPLQARTEKLARIRADSRPRGRLGLTPAKLKALRSSLTPTRTVAGDGTTES